MAIYQETPDGLLPITEDKSLTDVVTAIQQEQILQGEEVSPCIKDTLQSTKAEVEE